MRTSLIKTLFKYANERKLLPLTGDKLFRLQTEAFREPKNFKVVLNKELVKKFNITLEQWETETSYMGEHYFPSLDEKHIPINNFIKKIVNEMGVYSPAIQRNYFYSLLQHAFKRNQITRKKKNNVYIYDIV